MPRQSRKSSESCFFHVMVQGINKEFVFNEERFITLYCKLLHENLKKYDVKIIAYCIMNNHAHMLIYTEKIDELSKYMHRVNTIFSMYYNTKLERVGVVFRNRFESEPILSQKHLFNCIAYIHNNPVKANLVANPAMYKYSSYNNYINKNMDDEILRLVFGTSIDYIETFKMMHRQSMDFDFKEVKNIEDWGREIDRIVKCDIGTIIMDKTLLENSVIKLIKENKIPIKNVCEKFKISRYKVSKILQKYK